MKKRYKSLFEQFDKMYQGEKYYERKYNDPIAMKELELYMENDRDVYKHHLEIVKNLLKKIRNGKYNHSKAPKIWMYNIELGAKKYAKEFGGEWYEMFPKKDRIILSQKLADWEYDEIMSGEYDYLV